MYKSTDITFRTRTDAENVLRRMKETADCFETVSIADMHTFAGSKASFRPVYNGTRYGWTLQMLKDAKIVPVHCCGYAIDAGPTMYIGKKTEEERTKAAKEKIAEAVQDYEKMLLTRKHFICIATPSHRDISRYCRDLLECLRMRGIPAKINVPAGSVETDHVTTKMVTPAMIGYGLRCDQCFGFRYEDALRLKRTPYPGYSELTSVTDYIVKIEKELKGEENYIMNDANVTQELYKMMRRANFTYEKPSAKPTIEDVIFNDPATIVMWSDGTKTVVKAENEPFDPEKGLAMAISKKNLGNKHDYYITFKKYLKKYYKTHPEKHDKTEDYRPVVKAYSALMAVALTKGNKADLEAAITEAIGYLGEALSE